MSLQYRRGDPLFVRQEARPAGDLLVRPGVVIVASEATGHTHRLTAGSVLETADGALYLDLPVAAQVDHEEHDAITLGAGIWLVIRQRAYTPGANRTVLD